MKIILLYLHIQSEVDRFRPYAKRFIETYRKFPGGIDHDLHVVICNGPLTAEAVDLYPEAKAFHRYQGTGFDIGAHQAVARTLWCDFLICTCSSIYFKREGWLARFAQGRQQHGDGLYAAMASYEVSPHLRTAFYGLHPDRFREYPYTINSKDDSFRFEHRDWSVSGWVESLKKPVLLVTWTGIYEKPRWRTTANGFRQGNQSDCLVFDRHNDIYDGADPGTRAITQAAAGG